MQMYYCECQYFEGLSNHSAQVDEYEYELNLREETKTNIKTL